MERDMKGHERKMGPAEKDRRGGRSKENKEQRKTREKALEKAIKDVER